MRLRMSKCLSPRHVVALALACAALPFFDGTARAAFSISVNGTTVVTDDGTGDANSATGEIRYTGSFAGYDLQFTSQTDLSSLTVGDITTSQLMVRNVSGTIPLTITITETAFNVPQDALGNSTLFSSFTRNLSAAQGTSGTDSMTSTAVSATGGGVATTDMITLPDETGSNHTTTTFNRTSAIYSLTTNVTVNGLQIGDAVVLTSDSAVTGGTVPPLTAAAPPGAVMLLSGLPVLWLWRRRQIRAA
jgi:hypothetical protein